LPLLTRVDRHYVPTCVWCSDGRLISRTGRSRFPTASAFANYAGAAPVEIASAEKSRHRLSRHGDRQLNSALHTIAITQIRMSGSRGNLYYRTKIAEGKTPREAARCLKETPRRPHLARHDHRRTTAGGEPGRTSGGGSAIQRGWLNPNNQLFGQVTSQTHRPRLYDDQASRLTNTEAPKGLVGVIGPWHYPLTMAICNGLAALVAGNAIQVSFSHSTCMQRHTHSTHTSVTA
jgi:hypothetical protein